MISFDGSSSHPTDPSSTILTWNWDFGDGTNAQGFQVAHAYSHFGTFTMSLIVTDNFNHTSTDVKAVTVNQGNRAPVSIPGGPYTVYEGNPVSFDGSASNDLDVGCGDFITKYEWDIVNDGVIDLTGIAPTLTSHYFVGTYFVSLRVTDSFGATGTASTTLTVLPAPTPTPTQLPCDMPTVTFAPANTFGTDATPLGINSGDFNGDGIQDLVVANFNSSNLSVYFGTGNGTFGAPTNFAVGAGPFAVAVGDLNNDGKPDLVAVSAISNSASILLGNGAGSFSLATTLTGLNQPHSLVIADLNHDNKQDLVVPNFSSSNNVKVFLGDGLGNFAAPRTFSAGTTPNSVAVGDFNGDTNLDLAFANLNSNDVSLLLGDGSGGFGTATNFAIGTNPSFVMAQDFDGDHKLDLAVTFAPNSVAILLGSGTGSFGPATNYQVGISPLSLVTADFNRDGKLDIATSNGTSNDVFLLLGDGHGAFMASPRIPAGTLPRSVVVGDFNGDGAIDIATANQASNNVSVLLNNGPRCPSTITWASPADITYGTPLSSTQLNASADVPGTLTYTPAAGTVLNAGTGQVLSVTFTPQDQSIYSVTSKQVTINVNKRNATWTTNPNSKTFGATNPVPLTTGSGGNFLANDGVSASYSRVAGETVGGSPYHISANLNSVVMGALNNYNLTNNGADFNILKAVTTTSLTSSLNPSVFGQAITLTANVASSNGTPTGTVQFFDYGQSIGLATLSAGQASLTTAALAAGSHSITAVYSGNTNVLGSTSPLLIQTVAAITPVGWNVQITEKAGPTTVQIEFENITAGGTTTITPIDPAQAGSLPGGFSLPGSNMAFDISTTATFVGPITVCFKVPSVTDPVAFSKLRVLHTVPKLDVAGANPNNNNTPIFLGNGAGGFAPATSFAVGSYPQSVAKGDFNGDGKLDLAVANSSSNNVSVLSGNGSGGFGPATNFAVGNYPISVVTGDFNRDGRPDLAVANYAGNNVSVLLANAAGGFAAPANFAVGANPRSVVIGDFNGDGKLDLAVANTNSNNVSILLGNGTGGFSPATVFAVGQSPFSVVAGDFNRDGKLDLAVANYASHSVSILFGNGAGSFAPASNVGLGNNQSPLSMAVGDFNGDGKLDLVTANALFGNVEVLIGNGTGAFSATFNSMQLGLTSVVTADFNNDGKLDLATGSASNGLSVRLGLGTGNFGAVTTYASGNTLYGLAVGNFNGDVAVVDQTILSGPDAPNFATRTICARVLSFSPIVIASADDQTSPVISNVSADPSVIWPPNHDMIDVTINYDVADDFTAAAEIVSSLDVSSNEPVDTTGDGNTGPDIEIVDAHHVRVRAERSGNGSGRVYTITITCKDSAQNTSQTTVTVVVPKSQH